MCYVFFFKQKTAYDMRISDWSSDVCSSDLAKMRSRLYQTSTIPRLDVAGVGWATQINVPKLPRDWRVRDVQILPSDEGLAVQVMVSNGQGEVMSLFAVRADMDAPVNPDVVSEGGDSIAYWQEGDQIGRAHV